MAKTGNSNRGREETFQIAFIHRRLSRRNVVQLAVLHPLLQLAHQVEQMVEEIPR